MKLTLDTDEILYKIVKDAFTGLSLTGGVYRNQRPLNSTKEDVVVNTITLSQDSDPQLGQSNVNIHVPDLTIALEGVQQNVPNTARLKTLANAALTKLRSTIVQGLATSVDFQTIIEEPEIKQNYVNIRISWNIHN